MGSYDIIILTDERYETPDESHWYQAQLLGEERLLMAGLEARGLRTTRVAWSNPDFDWSRARAAVFRSTWDYFERFAEFSAWMERVADSIPLFNAPELVRWNVDKHYLRGLAERGVNVPMTRFIEPGETTTLREVFAVCGRNEAILKPAVSGAARHTYRLNATNLEAHESVLRELLHAEAMMVQPFLGSVLTEGELSLTVIGGRCTHAVRKIAKPGDFRVQDDHGGTVHHHTPTAEEVAFAEAAVAACPQSPLYARVDAVRDESGELSLMELELVEPELFFRFHPPAADALAAAIAERL
ncbi:MAG: RimK family alpha-L-glutamate ligase [Prosthecobacter sp.]|uniref:ATP-grasp domain-containing protein n=1 Tax=Prosthecobacter sp. TaxID=1965333 RepID=UPI0038FF4163